MVQSGSSTLPASWLHVKAATAHTNASPMLEHLSSGGNIGSNNKENKDIARKLSTNRKHVPERIEDGFQLARITHDTCTHLPSQPSTYCCSPSLMGDSANAATVGLSLARKRKFPRRRPKLTSTDTKTTHSQVSQAHLLHLFPLELLFFPSIVLSQRLCLCLLSSMP